MLLNPIGKPINASSTIETNKSSNAQKNQILIVEDEVLMRSLIEKYLKSSPLLNDPSFKIEQKESGWDLLEQDLSHVKIAVVDILLPRVTGVDLIRNLRKRYPEMGIIAVTGMATEPMKRALLEMIPESLLLQKPLRKEIFGQALQNAWNNILPPLESSPPTLGDDGEALWTSAAVDLRATEVPVVHRRLGRKKASA